MAELGVRKKKMEIIDPRDFEKLILWGYLMTIAAIIPPAVAETFSAKLELSREPFAAVIVLMVSSVLFRIYAIGPHGGVLRSEFHELQTIRLIPSDTFVLIASVYTLIIIFLLLTFSIALARSEYLSTAIRFLCVSPFIFYIVQALVRMRNFEIEI